MSQLRIVVIAALAVLVCPVEVMGEAVPVPFTRQPLDATRVEVRVFSGTIDVEIDDLAEPSLEVTTISEAQDVAVMLLSADGEALELVQPYGADGADVPVRVRLVVNPGQRISVEGRDVDVSVRDRRDDVAGPEAAEPDEPRRRGQVARPGGEASRYAFDLERSSISLERLPAGKITGRRNDIVLKDCRGPFVFDVIEGEAEIAGHVGELFLSGRDSRFQVDGMQGRLDLSLEAGHVAISSGQGRLKGELAGGSMTLDEWQGAVDVDGDQARITARRLPIEEVFFEARGAGNDLLLEDLAGALRLHLEGGRVEARSVRGRAMITAEKASEMHMTDLGDNVRLQVSGDSFVSLDRVRGIVEGRVKDSELTASSIEEGVDLRGRAAIVSLFDVSNKLSVEFTDSIVDVEMMTRSLVRLGFSGESEASIGLPTPCLIRLEGRRARDEAPPGLGLGPCRQYDRSRRRQLSSDERPVTVNLKMQGEPRVEFWGR